MAVRSSRGAKPRRRQAAAPSGAHVGRTATIADRVYETIKARIIQLDMPPEYQFTEGELAEDLGASKSPIREALGRLRLEGLVTVASRAGYRVTSVTLRDVVDLFQLRALLEGEAAALAARHGDDIVGLTELDAACQVSDENLDPSGVSRFIRANSAFHLRIATMSRNERLVDVTTSVLEQLDRVVYLGRLVGHRREDIESKHGELVEAIESGDEDAARAAAAAHVEAVRARVVGAFVASDAVMTTSIGGGTTRPRPPAPAPATPTPARKPGRRVRKG